ncbi:hypothetical protein EV368DRAFT_63941 [Lentinula lateritia]|nr:hypothetical protein EV368DRAFT_63941 [Lentinula lateritia]
MVQGLLQIRGSIEGRIGCCSVWVLGLWQKLSTTCKYQENWRDEYTTAEQVVKDPIVAVEFPTAEHVFEHDSNHAGSTWKVVAMRKKKLEEAYLPASLRDVEAQIEANPCLKLFTKIGNEPSPGWQEDSISCIPASMNTIGHGIFGDKLWEHDHLSLERLVWFTTLVPDIVKEKTHVVWPILSNLLNPAEEVAYCDILEAVEAEVEGLDGPEYDAQEISTSEASYEQPTVEPPPVSDDSKKPNKLTSAWASFGFATQTLPSKTSKKCTAVFKEKCQAVPKQGHRTFAVPYAVTCAVVLQ